MADALKEWDGDYAVDSRGAVAYQRVLDRLLAGYYADRYGEAVTAYLRGSVAVHDFVREDVEAGAIDAETIRDACAAAADGFSGAGTWGEQHRIRLRHPLGSIPLLGARYRYGDVPASGSSTTVRKSAHRVSGGRHAATFGQNSRHVSDLSDPDENHFVLLGGQDGWHGSENLLDQVPLYQEGRYVRIPLREESVRAAFRHRTALTSSRGEER
jgi:penicillin amidase